MLFIYVYNHNTEMWYLVGVESYEYEHCNWYVTVRVRWQWTRYIRHFPREWVSFNFVTVTTTSVPLRPSSVCPSLCSIYVFGCISPPVLFWTPLVFLALISFFSADVSFFISHFVFSAELYLQCHCPGSTILVTTSQDAVQVIVAAKCGGRHQLDWSDI